MSDQPKPTRRWFQFSLRTLFVVLTGVAVWLGVQVNRANRQQRAVQAITKNRGEFLYDYQHGPPKTYASSLNFTLGVGPLVSYAYDHKAEPPGPDWARQVIGDHYFIRPTLLRVFDQRVIDNDCLSYLKDLPGLEQVTFDHVTLGPEHLQYLKHLPRLKILHLSVSPQPSAQGWDFRFLSNLHDLRVVSITNLPFKGSDLEYFREAAGLRALGLHRTGADDQGIAHLGHVKKLQFLMLADSAVTDRGLVHLSSLPNLVYLELRRTAVTDSGLGHLAKIESLKQVNLVGTQVTADGVNKLQQARANLKVVW